MPAPRLPGFYWDGIIHPDSVPNPAALQNRRRLFKAAERHDWAGVLEILEGSNERTLNMVCPECPSWYTVLHHAAAGNADTEVIEKLQPWHPLRSMRCAAGERPVDIALRLGHHQLEPLLMPELKQQISEQKLAGLEQQLHKFILEETGPRGAAMRLPPLEVLLELEDPMMTFMVPYMGGGFSYRLQKVDFPLGWMTTEEWVLPTRHHIHMFQGSEARYVVTTHGWVLLAEPFVE